MTEKLYETDGLLSSFTGSVVSVSEENGLYGIELDRTAFFPGGGGQEADKGTLDGFSVVRMTEKDGRVYHWIEKKLSAGDTVKGEVDFDVRFPRMQSHTGEHIFSGTVHSLYGCDNVGFHMGPDGMTVDFNRELTLEELKKAEQLANETVWKNVPVKVSFPSSEELRTLAFRSKKELEGRVRIVTVEGCDICACCAPHLDCTGRVGLIKVLDPIRWRGGIRLRLLCGAAALEDYRIKYSNNKSVAEALAVKQNETAAAFAAFSENQESLKRSLTEAKKKIALLKAEMIAPTCGNLCLFEEGLTTDELRFFVNEASSKCSGLCGGFSKTAEGWLYVIEGKNLKKQIREINAGISGKGGGSDEMLTGKAMAAEEQIKRFFDEYNPMGEEKSE